MNTTYYPEFKRDPFEPFIERRKRPGLTDFFIQHPYRAYAMAILVAITLSLLSANTAWALSPVVQQQGEVSFITGGIGEDERDALEAVKGDYNLHITSADKGGHFRGDTRIIITDTKGNETLDVTTEGPLFYANLPDGKYTVQGVSEGQTKKQTITVKGAKRSTVQFSWTKNADATLISEPSPDLTVVSPKRPVH